MPRHKGQRRKEARDAKYNMVGVDLSVEGGDDTFVIGHYDRDVFSIDKIERVRQGLHRIPSEELFDLFRRASGQPIVIEGEFEEVQTDPSRLLDAGGSEP